MQDTDRRESLVPETSDPTTTAADPTTTAADPTTTAADPTTTAADPTTTAAEASERELRARKARREKGRPPGFLGLAAVLLALVGPAAGARTPNLELKVANRVSGTPLQVEVEVSGWSREEALGATLFLDGRSVGRHRLVYGTNSITVPETEVGTGSHRVEIKSGSLKATAEFTALPGWLSLLPPLIAIGLALLTKDVLLSLFLGVFGGSLILYGWNPFLAFARTADHFIVPSLADPGNMAIVVFTLFLGGMVGLITRSGGTQGIVERLAPYATTTRRGQLATAAMGTLIFFDDYANTLIVGPTMRPITDRLRISREKLAYIVDSTAAPVVCLFPISTWVGFEIGLISDAFEKLDLPLNAYSVFLYSIPYRFYPIFALLTVFTLAVSRRDFGPMRKAELRARKSGALLPEGAVPIADYGSEAVLPPEETPKRAANALLPIATVVLLTLYGLYVTGSAGLVRDPEAGFGAWARAILSNANSSNALLWASLSGMVVALVLPLAQKILTIKEGMSAMVAGFKAMFMALIVLTLAWSIGAVCSELQTAAYLVGIVRGVVAPFLLPALTFLLAAAVAFATGSSWGTMSILEPLVIPIAHNLSTASGLDPSEPLYAATMIGSIASVLAGSVWGDHCSPISDTTILSSMATGCDHIAHVRTQLPYALTLGVLGILLGSIPTALGISPWVSLLVGASLILGFVVVAGRWQDRRSAAESGSG